MKKSLYGTTALATPGLMLGALLMMALAGCEQTPRDPNAPPEEPIRLGLGGYMSSTFAFGEEPDEE